jgi:hypothetical protein
MLLAKESNIPFILCLDVVGFGTADCLSEQFFCFGSNGGNGPLERGGGVQSVKVAEQGVNQKVGVGVGVESGGGSGDERQGFFFGQGDDFPKGLGHIKLLNGIVVKFLVDARQQGVAQIGYAHSGHSGAQQCVVDGGAFAKKREPFVSLQAKLQGGLERFAALGRRLEAKLALQIQLEQKISRGQYHEGGDRIFEQFQKNFHTKNNVPSMGRQM